MARTATGWLAGIITGVATLAALAGCGHQHQHQHVDATTTTAAPPDLPSTAPTALTQRAWSARHPADLPVVVDSGYAVIADKHGVSVRDATTGHERWHYQDPQHTLVRDDQGQHQVVTGGGHVLIRYAAPHGQLIRVFDLLTGKLRRSLSTLSTHDTAVLDATRLYLISYVGVDTSRLAHGTVPVQAIDLSDGHRPWSYAPRCANGDFEADLNPWLIQSGGTSSTLVVAGSCGQGSDDSNTVTALSTRTGHVRWQDHAAGYPADRMADGGPVMLPAGAPIVLVDTANHRYTIVDTATGRATTAAPAAADNDLQPTTVATLWCTTNLNVPVSCFDTAGRLRWQRPLPGAAGTDRYPVGFAVAQPPTSTPDVMAMISDSRVHASGGKQRHAVTIELLRTDTGQPVSAPHQLPGATTTLGGSWPHQFVLHAYGPSGLFFSMRTDTSNMATLTAYR